MTPRLPGCSRDGSRDCVAVLACNEPAVHSGCSRAQLCAHLGAGCPAVVAPGERLLGCRALSADAGWLPVPVGEGCGPAQPAPPPPGRFPSFPPQPISACLAPVRLLRTIHSSVTAAAS